MYHPDTALSVGEGACVMLYHNLMLSRDLNGSLRVAPDDPLAQGSHVHC